MHDADPSSIASVPSRASTPPKSSSNAQLCDAIIAAIRASISDAPPQAQVALHQPTFSGREWEYVKECLDTGWVSSVGSFVDRFERMLAEMTDVPHAVATMNGTAALHACFLLAGVRPGDEVILPSLSFIATANAVSYCGGIPHFVDSTTETLGMDPIRLERHLAAIADRRNGTWHNKKTGRPIRAISPMHTYGHPVDLDPIIDLCRSLNIALIEDAAESIGSLYKGRPTGRAGRLAALSFNGNKTVTTGSGGAILTSDPKLGAAAKHLTTTARIKHGWRFDHDQIGYNYRLPNINAALGCAQLEQLDGFIARKRALAQRYARAFAGLSGVQFFVEPPFATSNYWLNVLLLDPEAATLRDAVLSATNDAGLQTRPAWTLMHHLPMYRDCPRDELPVAEDIERRLINLPSSPTL
jgi:perosamine synthetase